MNSPAHSILDISALLVPCSDIARCGDDTRTDSSPQSPYFSLKDLRHQARAHERNTIIDEDAQLPEQWRQLARQLPEVIRTRSKDLELIAWLVEALCRENGFTGLISSFDLTKQLIENYWDDIHPMPDEEGMLTRLSPLIGLNGFDRDGTLIQPILAIPIIITAGESFATWQCEQAVETARLHDNKADKKIQAGATAPDDISRAAREMSDDDIIATHQQILNAQQSFQALSEALDTYSGEQQPSTRITSTLQRCLDAFNYQLGERLQKLLTARDYQNLEPITDSSEANEASPDTENPFSKTISNREQAVQQLRQLAEIFRSTEPHSPVSYAVDQAVRWSEMSLPELMNELIDDPGALTRFSRLTGVPAVQGSPDQ